MKKTVLLFVLITTTFASFAQKYKKMGYQNTVVENKEVKITADDAISTEKFLKVKLRIKNKTNDYLIFNASDCVFKINGQDMKTEERMLLIAPNDEDFRVIDIKGAGLQVESFKLEVNGLSRFPADSKGIAAPNFNLPPSMNDFSAGPFKVNMVRMNKETQRTDVKFRAVYAGEKIGIFEPGQVAVRMPNGKEFASAKSDRKPLIFMQGEEDTFTTSWYNDAMIGSGDMQKVDMLVLWRDAFKEVAPTKMESQILDVKFSPVLSK